MNNNREKIVKYLKENLSDNQLIHLIKLRIKNSNIFGDGTILRIDVEERTFLGFTCIVYSKEYTPERIGMTFEMFYTNEFAYLLNCGFVFETTEGTIKL